MKIFTDSACDLPLSFFNENDVNLIPLHVLIDGQQYEDMVEIDSLEVYEAIRQGSQPKTSQVSPEHVLGLWTELAQSNEKGIYIAFSSELSGTYNTAVMMKKQVQEDYPEFDLTIIDTKCASLGYGLIVKEAVRLHLEGATKETLIQRIQFMARHMEHLFTVNDLDYLAQGGRVSKASAFIGSLLNIKPLLHVENGKLIPFEKHRGRKKIIRRMLQLIEERGEDLKEQTIAISHSDDEAIAIELKNEIMKRFQPKEIEIHLIGSVIGAHVGPGTFSVFFLNKLK